MAGGITTTYVHDVFGNLAAEYTTGGTSPPPASPCNTCYLTWDHLGSTRMVTDAYGNSVARHDYYPFGAEIPVGIGRMSEWGTTDNVSLTLRPRARLPQKALFPYAPVWAALSTLSQPLNTSWR